MKRISCPCIALAAFLIGGCNAVYSTKPIGETPVAIAAAEWDGVWVARDGAVTVKTLDETNGVIQAAWVQQDDKTRELKLQSIVIELRDAHGWIIGNVESLDEPGLYSWARFKKDANAITIWAPDIEKFKALVSDRTLAGDIRDNGDVVLRDLTADQVKMIVSGEKGVLLNWENPGFFVRQAR